MEAPPLGTPAKLTRPATGRPGAARRLLGSALLAYVAWCAVLHLRGGEASSLFGTVDFGVHEFGHMVFGMFGEWIGVAGGSIMQLAIPVLVGLMFWNQHERLGVAVCGGWLAISLARMAVYMADARVLELDLVSLGPDTDVHDWNYLFKSMGLIRYDTEIAGAVRLAAWLVLLASLVWGLRCLWTARETRPDAA